MATPIVNDLAGVTTALTTIFTWIISLMGDMVDLVLSQPLLFIPIGIIATYAVVNLFKRMF